MYRYRAERKKKTGSMFCALAAVLLAALLAGTAAATTAPAGTDDPEMILAQGAVAHMNLHKPDGSPLVVWSGPDVPGRGAAARNGGVPDYLGLFGYAALPNDPEISRFSVFDKAYWTVPLYRKADKGYVQDGTIMHKMPVVITGQTLEPDGEGAYRGYLEAVRLDTFNPCILDVKCFVTLPYWKLPVSRIPAYGYCIAVYRESPGMGPRYEDGNACFLRDGTRVLIPFEGACLFNNPAPEKLEVQGIVFQDDGQGVITSKIVYFREADLVPNY